MKKNKRTWLLLAGVAALSATLLVPTVLSACSSTPENENPGDGSEPGGDGTKPDEPSVPNILNEELSTLNKSDNKDVRTNLYSKYIKSLDLKSIANNDGFFDQLINMIKDGLTVGDTTSGGKITETDLSKLIEALNTDRSLMTTTSNIESNNELTTGSYWSSFAFEFNDTQDSTWTFTNKDKNVQYELFLTSNVNVEYESTPKDVKAKIKNNANGSKVQSRFVVRTKVSPPKQGEEVATTIHEFNFKPDYEFALPSELFTGLTSFFNKYSESLKTLKDTLKSGLNKYEEIVKKGISQQATLWNQFAVLNFEQMQHQMNSDLNVNRDESRVAKWIVNNFNSTASGKSTSTIDKFKSDLSAADSVQLDLYPLTIKGSTQSSKNLNDASDETPGFTLAISFNSSSDDALDSKWYVVDLYATGLEIKPQVSDDAMFGYISSSFTTTPKLKLDSNSSFGSFTIVAASQQGRNGYEIGDVKPVDAAVGLKQVGAFTDVSDLYDFGTSGFKEYLSNLITDASGSNAQSFDAILKANDGNVDAIAKLKEYINENKESVKNQLLQPDNLADLILNNIDVSNIAMHSAKFGTENTNPTDTIPGKNFKNGNMKGWRETINSWVSGSNNKDKPNVTFKAAASGGNPYSADEVVQSVSDKFKKAADITIRAESATDTNHSANGTTVHTTNNPLDFGTPDFKFRSIYIFLGSGTSTQNTNTQSTIVNGFDGKNSSFATLDADLKQATASDNGTDKTWDQILQAVQNKFCIVLEKAKTDQTQGTLNPPVYALYMGQQKTSTGLTLSSGAAGQSKFPISLDALLGDGKAFLAKFK